MKTILITFLLATVFAALAKAAPVSARYLRFEGYYSSNTSTSQQIGIYEIEAYSSGLNAAKTATVTANSVYPSNSSTYLNYLKDGNTAGSLFYSSRTSPGPASEAAPHWVQMDLASVMPIDRIKIYLHPSHLIGCGVFLSSDATNWTRYGCYDQVNGLIETDPLAPRVTIESAAMRPGTTLMDVVYRVRDHDDATVKTRALAFVDGVRSFANVLKPVTFVEGTAARLGDTIAVNVSHTLTWDVGADWNIDLGQVKFEILARDGRGLLVFDWISIPAVGANPALTISKDAPTDASVLSALFWQYADGDTGLTLENGVIRGNNSSGVFSGLQLAKQSTIQAYSVPYLFKIMNLDPATTDDISYAVNIARGGLLSTAKWHAVNRAYAGVSTVLGWGANSSSQNNVPSGPGSVVAIATGLNNILALRTDGTVINWGDNSYPVPTGLTGISSIAAGWYQSMAVRNDGTIINWGTGGIPSGITGVSSITLGQWLDGPTQVLVLKKDGSIIGWDSNSLSALTLPSGLSGVIAVAAGRSHGIALKNDGTVVGWGGAIPVGLSGITAIAAGTSHSLALKSDGTVVAWGSNTDGQITIPAGLSGVIAVAAGSSHSLALKSDGTVVGWGLNDVGQITIPNGLIGVSSIIEGYKQSYALKSKAP